MEGIYIQTVNSTTSNEDKQITYPIVEKAGIRDWILNYFFDLSVFQTRICDKITGISLRHTDEYIYSIEFFYDHKSTGEFKGNFKEDLIKLFTIHIPIGKDDYISSVKGTYNVDYITGLEFILHSGESYGFHNKYTNAKTDIKYFMFKNEESIGLVREIISFKIAFGKYLTFISPIFKESIKLIKNELNHSYATPPLGRFNNDLKQFYVKEHFGDIGKLKRICIYHDNVIVKGVELGYENEYTFNFHNYSHYEDLNKLKMDVIELDIANSECITKIMIRSGDLIDNITIYTNKGKIISAGGHGGFPVIFNLDEISKIQNKNLVFIGIECGYSGKSGNMQYIKLIFI